MRIEKCSHIYICSPNHMDTWTQRSNSCCTMGLWISEFGHNQRPGGHSQLMSLANLVQTASTNPLRFVGRPSRHCRACQSAEHYVNRAGGIECIVCSPPSEREAGDLTRLWSVDGKWDAKPDEWNVGTVGAVDGSESITSPTTPSATTGIHPGVYQWCEDMDRQFPGGW